jgi:hypothetical protein
MGATPASARSAHRASGSGADDDDADDDGAFENEEDGSNDDPLATANADGTSSGRAARFSAQRKNERGGGLTPVADKADDDDADELSVFVDTAAGAELGTVSLPNTDWSCSANRSASWCTGSSGHSANGARLSTVHRYWQSKSMVRFDGCCDSASTSGAADDDDDAAAVGTRTQIDKSAQKNQNTNNTDNAQIKTVCKITKILAQE